MAKLKDTPKAKIAPELRELTDTEHFFVASYLRYFDKGRAAKDYGSKAKDRIGLATVGHDIYERPHVKKFIKDYIKKKCQTPNEIINNIDDMSRTNLNLYMITKKVPVEVRVKVSIIKAIEEQRIQLAIVEDALEEGKLLGFDSAIDESLSRQDVKIERRRLQKLESEYKVNPSAFRWEMQIQMEERTTLDLKAVKNAGIILKSYKETKNGIEVEVYSRLEAANLMGKIGGVFEKDNKQKGSNVKLLSFDPLAEVEDLANDEDEG